jgi:hypothetical protein
MNMLADLVHIEKSPEIVPAPKDTDYLNETVENYRKVTGIGAEEKEINPYNYAKILYLNNHDPSKYSLDYW